MSLDSEDRKALKLVLIVVAGFVVGVLYLLFIVVNGL